MSSGSPPSSASEAALAQVFREETGRLVAGLVRFLGDFDLAEELVQEAVLSAIVTWPVTGIPARPAAWLTTTSRRKAIDRIRREARYRDKLVLLAASEAPAATEPDDRLRLIFTCCHPALAREAQLALTLRAVCGLTTAEIARAFLAGEAAMAQRIVRAKRKIVESGIPYRVPTREELGGRLAEVLAVLYLLFNEGYLASGGPAPDRRDLAVDAEWLASLLVRLLPGEPEAIGLLALMRLHLARAGSRFDADGRLILLRDQDRSTWDRRAIAAAGRLIVEAGELGRPGPYQIQAAIAALHSEAPSWEEIDWEEIVALYSLLLAHQPSPVVRLNRAIALRHLEGPGPALAEVDAVAGELESYHLLHATRAELLRDLGRPSEARAEDGAALGLTRNPAERELLRQRLLD
ncbi:MAG TPA: RNA polymerase sigma factor [Candidatus Dormibacteraeota bacterium]|nr:RNA polymerase sigma factor [Candidatus Dormibacteraeota bacterium]